MLKNAFAKINIKKIIQILKKRNLLLYYSDTLNQISDEHEIKIFYHSKDVDSSLELSSDNTPIFAYVARTGKTFDGHKLAEKVLYSKNIFIGEADRTKQNIDNTELLKQSYFIEVTDTRKALNNLLEEAYKLNLSDFTFIGVTGTNGKTSVVQISGQILENIYKKHTLKIGTLGMEIGDQKFPGSHVTTPDFPAFISILNVAEKKHVNKVLMEITSHGLKEDRLADLKISIGVFTNLTQDHMDFHGSMEDYRASKGKMFRDLLSENGTAVINVNNDEWPYFVQAAAGQKRSLILVGDIDGNMSSPGLTRGSSDLFNQFASVKYLQLSSEHRKSDLTGISGTLFFKNQNEQILEKHPYTCPLLGDFQHENILCSVGVMLAVGVSLDKSCNALSHIKNIPGRLELVKSKKKKNTPTVIIDYAHTPDALEKSILTCKKLLSSQGKITTIFGCGGDRDVSKRPLMGKIASELSDFVIVTSDNPRMEDPDKIIHDIFMGMDKKDHCKKQKDRKNAIINAIGNANENDLILIAGKGHEDYQIIGEVNYPFSDEDVVRNIFDRESF